MNTGEIILYQNPEGNIRIDVRLEDETVWLNQDQMAILFGRGRTTITEHIQHVFNEGELKEEMVCREFRHTTRHGAIQGKTQEKPVKHYNLDVIISVGYRVKSPQGTQFWMLDAGSWMLDPGCWMLDTGCWILDNFAAVSGLAAWR